MKHKINKFKILKLYLSLGEEIASIIQWPWERSQEFHLWGQIFISSSDCLRSKSTKALLEEFVGRGGGSVSMLQNLFLANPCASRGPRFENCMWSKPYITKMTEIVRRTKKVAEDIYLRKAYWDSSTDCFWWLKYSLHSTTSNTNSVHVVICSLKKSIFGYLQETEVWNWIHI